jgi:predicted Zn finger-like uncharacterized protein
MAIRFACPTCRARLNVPDDAAGGSVRCPKCRALDRIPAESDPSDTVVRSADDTAEQPVPLFPSVAGEVVEKGKEPDRLASVMSPSRWRPAAAGPFGAGLAWGAGFWLAGLVAIGAVALARAVLG